ncbi:MAG: outer membrane protein transport protein [Planctomycetes bacterium]|nr:outer membrane protein transport protein [Planctomycetota bacterium]
MKLIPLLICFLLHSSLHAQLGGEVTGDTAQRAAMAGAGMASGTNLLDSAVNPAMLSFLPSQASRFESVGRAVWMPTKITTAEGDTLSLGNTLSGGPWLGYAGELGDDWSWAVSLVPTGGGQGAVTRRTHLNIATDPEVGPPWFPAPHDVEVSTRLLQLGIQPALSWKVHSDFSLGLGASLRATQIDMKSATDVLISSLTGEVPGLPGTTWSDLFEQLLAAGGRPEIDSIQADMDASASAPLHAFLQLGGMWQVDDDSRFSFWYRSPSTRQSLKGSVDVDVGADIGAILDFYELDSADSFDLEIANVIFPQQLGIAWMQEVGPSDRLFFDAAWTDWSSSFDGWLAKVTGGEGDLGVMLGGGEGTEIDMNMEWTDTVRLSMGYEYDLFIVSEVRDTLGRLRSVAHGSPMTLRFGLGHANNPIQGSATTGLTPFNSLHLGAGCSWWGGPNDGDWHFGFTVALPQEWHSGPNKVLSDFSGDSYEQSVWSLALGWSAPW